MTTTVGTPPPTPKPEKDKGHTPGEEGIWVFIFGDMTVFALFFGVIVYTQVDDPALFRRSQAELATSIGAINTLLLLTSSLFVVQGVRSLRRGVADVAPRLFALAGLCGAAFAVLKVVEYAGKLSAGITPATNDFFMYFFVFTGIHFLHLFIGMVVLAFLWRLSRKPRLTAKELSLVEGGASYWHMVDLLWIVLFPLLYLMQ